MPDALTVLLVDDDVDFRLQQKISLEAAGYHVVEADCIADASAYLDQHKPNLAIFDLMMEETDAGFSLCYQAKKRYPDLPVVMITGVASETGIEFAADTIEERSWVKADVILAKPIRFEQLQKEIDRLLKE